MNLTDKLKTALRYAAVVPRLLFTDDTQFIAGMCLLWWGLDSWYPPPIGCGSVLICVSLFSAARTKAKPKDET